MNFILPNPSSIYVSSLGQRTWLYLCVSLLMMKYSLVQVDAQLSVPLVLTPQNGTYQITLEETTVSIPNSEITLGTRLFNGLLPGPTFRVQPGDEFQVVFSNNLVDQGIPFQNNELSAPDESNLHFHGLHISGELPSDDTTHVVKPAESYTYTISLPTNHMPGTHWMHPHRHGSTSLQVGGGAVSAVIVEDPPGTLPSQVENAKEVLIVAQQMDFEELRRTSLISQDNLISVSGDVENRIVLVNGEFVPTISIVPGEWNRFRIIWAAWLVQALDFTVDGCEMQLLAKDGIYIRAGVGRNILHSNILQNYCNILLLQNIFVVTNIAIIIAKYRKYCNKYFNV